VTSQSRVTSQAEVGSRAGNRATATSRAIVTSLPVEKWLSYFATVTPRMASSGAFLCKMRVAAAGSKTRQRSNFAWYSRPGDAHLHHLATPTNFDTHLQLKKRSGPPCGKTYTATELLTSGTHCMMDLLYLGHQCWLFQTPIWQPLHRREIFFHPVKPLSLRSRLKKIMMMNNVYVFCILLKAELQGAGCYVCGTGPSKQLPSVDAEFGAKWKSMVDQLNRQVPSRREHTVLVSNR